MKQQHAKYRGNQEVDLKTVSVGQLLDIWMQASAVELDPWSSGMWAASRAQRRGGSAESLALASDLAFQALAMG